LPARSAHAGRRPMDPRRRSTRKDCPDDGGHIEETSSMRSPRAERGARWGKPRTPRGLLLPRATVTPVRGGSLVRWTGVLVALVVWLSGPARADDTGWIAEGKLGVLAHDIRRRARLSVMLDHV